ATTDLTDVLVAEVGVCLDVVDGHDGGSPYASMVTSPAATPTQVRIREPGSLVSPVRRSWTWPSTSSRTQVWQMPMRQPKGICTPAASPASRIVVAPSTVVSTLDLAKVIVPPFAS